MAKNDNYAIGSATCRNWTFFGIIEKVFRGDFGDETKGFLEGCLCSGYYVI